MPKEEIPEFSRHPRNIQYANKVARILNQTETGIARVFADQSDNFLERQYGTVFAILDLDFTSDFYDIGEVVVETLVREYFSDLNQPALKSFERALTAVNQTLADLAAEGQNDWVGKLNALVGVIHENEIHLSMVGKAEAYLVRGPSVTHITADLRSDPKAATAKTFLDIASGSLEVGDKLIFATSEVFNKLSQNDIRRHLYLHPPTRAIRKIADQLTERGRPGRLAAVVVELTTIDLVSAEAVTDDPDEIILGAPRGHFEALQKLRPFRQDTPIADLTNKAKKHWDKKLQPGLKRSAASARHKAQTFIAQRRGQTPPPPPPRPAAGTPEVPHHEPVPTDTASQVSEHAKTATDAASRTARDIGQKISETTSQLWRKSGIPETKAWRKVREVTAPLTSRIGAAWRKAGTDRRSTLYRNLIVGLVAILVISLWFSIRASQNHKAEAKVRADIAHVQEVQAKAEASYIFKDIPGARQQIDEAKKQTDSLAKQKHLKPQVAELQQSVDTSYNRINNIVAVPNQPLADFGALTGKTPLTHVVQSGTTLYAIGETGGLQSFNETTKDTKTAVTNPAPAGAKIRSATTTTNGDVLLLTDKPSVLTVDTAAGSTAEAQLAAGASWEAGDSLDTIQQSVFILDPAKNQIWKHSKTGDGFAAGEPYLNGQFDLKNATDLVTGSQAYVLKQGGQVLQFSGGAAQPFNLGGTPSPADSVHSANAIAVNFATGLLYVSDPANKRVVEYNLKGEYQRQFTTDAFSGAQNLTVDDKTNQLFVLAGNKVFQVNLGS